MPKIYEYLGISFTFFANDHLPIHVHATYAGHVTVFEFIFEKGKLVEIKTRKVRGKEHLPVNKFKEAEQFVNVYAEDITQKWNDFFVRNADLKPVKITKKL